jgi:hypothetical protein
MHSSTGSEIASWMLVFWKVKTNRLVNFTEVTRIWHTRNVESQWTNDTEWHTIRQSCEIQLWETQMSLPIISLFLHLVAYVSVTRILSKCWFIFYWKLFFSLRFYYTTCFLSLFLIYFSLYTLSHHRKCKFSFSTFLTSFSFAPLILVCHKNTKF